MSESVDDEAEYELEEVSLGRSRSWGWIVAAIAILALLCAALIALGYMDWAREPLERLISS